jgi:hypothetical protein
MRSFDLRSPSPRRAHAYTRRPLRFHGVWIGRVLSYNIVGRETCARHARSRLGVAEHPPIDSMQQAGGRDAEEDVQAAGSSRLQCHHIHAQHNMSLANSEDDNEKYQRSERHSPALVSFHNQLSSVSHIHYRFVPIVCTRISKSAVVEVW